MPKRNVCIVAGARPNFVKVAPLIRAIDKTDEASYELVYAGREDDPTLEPSLFADLDMPRPNVYLGADAATAPKRQLCEAALSLCAGSPPGARRLIEDGQAARALEATAAVVGYLEGRLPLGAPLAALEALGETELQALCLGELLLELIKARTLKECRLLPLLGSVPPVAARLNAARLSGLGARLPFIAGRAPLLPVRAGAIRLADFLMELKGCAA